MGMEENCGLAVFTSIYMWLSKSFSQFNPTYYASLCGIKLV